MCLDGTSTACDCSSCPVFESTPSPAFSACGGQPFGVWEVEDYQVNPILTLPSASCPYLVKSLLQNAAMAPFRIALEDGGTAEVSAEWAPQVTFSVQQSCVGDCQSVSSPNTNLVVSCTDDTCGTCNCTAYSTIRGVYTGWTRTDTTITVTDAALAGGYCVQGDTMTFEDSTGFIYSLRRMFVGGQPTDCSTRLSGTCSEGCTLGACQGGNLVHSHDAGHMSDHSGVFVVGFDLHRQARSVRMV